MTLLLVAPLTMFSGQLLNSRIDVLLRYPALLIVVPPLINNVGDLASILSARLSTALHIGFLEPRITRHPVLTKNLLMVTLISLIAFTFLGVVGSLSADALGLRGLGLLKGAAIAIIAGVTVTLLMEVLGTVIAFSTYRYGWDPDNVTSPVVTTIGDILGIATLFLVLGLFGV
ncbi:MAG: magnesium transporter [Candidatus Bathyarchaeia archaeon]